jgi:NAD(P)-dependent dehydrogenase (short-subunit alcohol dehydrogenase family)
MSLPIPWRHALVVGASSGIGAAVARQLADGGARVALVARRAAELETLARDIAAATADPGRALVFPHDVTHADEVADLLPRISHALGGLDLLVYAAGVMPRIGADEYDVAKDRAVFEVNVVGAIAWCNAVADRFVRAQAGTMIGISSVAGDRGRRGFPAYNASKAALDTYLEAIRNRVARHGVRVVTVKPGPVDTPMTRGMEKLPLLVSADDAARELLAGAARGRQVVYVPARWRPIMFVIRHIPSFVFRRLDLWACCRATVSNASRGGGARPARSAGCTGRRPSRACARCSRSRAPRAAASGSAGPDRATATPRPTPRTCASTRRA